MKKHILFVFLAIAAIACSKENQAVEEAPVADKDGKITVTFTASVNETKAMVSDGGAFTWSAGDRIAVYDEDTGTYYPFDIQGEGGSTTATFSAQLDAANYRFTKAVYPESLVSMNTSGQSADEVVIPEYVGFNRTSYIPLVAEVVNGTLSFEYLTAVVKITVDRLPGQAKWVRLKGINPIVGTMNLSTKSIASEGSSNQIYTEIGENAGHTFYFPVPSGQNAVTFEILDGGTSVSNSAVLFTTGEDNAKTVTFKAPSLYLNEVKVPINVYVNYSEPWVQNATPYIWFYNGGYNTGDINSCPIPTSGDYDVAFLAIGYYKVNVDLSVFTDQGLHAANVMVHNGYDNDPSGVPYGDLYQITKLVNIDNDLYIRVMPASGLTTSKVYFRNWSTNGWITNLHAWIESDNDIPLLGDWPGKPLNDMTREYVNFMEYPYIEVSAGTKIGYIGTGDNGNSRTNGDKYVQTEANKNTLVTLNDDDTSWSFDFPVATMQVNGN